MRQLSQRDAKGGKKPGPHNGGKSIKDSVTGSSGRRRGLREHGGEEGTLTGNTGNTESLIILASFSGTQSRIIDHERP